MHECSGAADCRFFCEPTANFYDLTQDDAPVGELIEPVRAGEQLFVDYGPSYAYDEHGFAR